MLLDRRCAININEIFRMLEHPLSSYRYRMQELDRCPSARNAYTFVFGWYRMGRHQQLQC